MYMTLAKVNQFCLTDTDDQVNDFPMLHMICIAQCQINS